MTHWYNSDLKKKKRKNGLKKEKTTVHKLPCERIFLVPISRIDERAGVG